MGTENSNDAKNTYYLTLAKRRSQVCLEAF